MIVTVGSANPAKHEPVKDVFSYHFDNVKIVGVDVDSGVADQPMSSEEMYVGALNRARKALEMVDNAEYGVGIEGGISKAEYGYYESSLVVIVNKLGEIGVGSSGGLVLPPKVMVKIKQGKTLEQAIDELFGTKKIGRGIGMFGVFTNKFVTRSSGTAHGVAFALSRFLHAKMWE